MVRHKTLLVNSKILTENQRPEMWPRLKAYFVVMMSEIEIKVASLLKQDLSTQENSSCKKLTGHDILMSCLFDKKYFVSIICSLFVHFKKPN